MQSNKRGSLLLFTVFFLSSFATQAQFSKGSRFTDWSKAGLESEPNMAEFQTIFVEDFGLTTDTTKSNSDSFENLLLTNLGKKTTIVFGNGTYLFTRSIKLPSNTIIQGSGADSTELIFNLQNSGNAIEIVGKKAINDSSILTKSIFRNGSYFEVFNPSPFLEGDWVILQMNDTALVTSSWAKGTVGQIFKLKNIANKNLYSLSQSRLAFPLTQMPYITKINPVKNVGIECLKITRMDNTAPSQTSSIFFQYAVNCWVKGIESSLCTFSHIDARFSSNLSVKSSYFHDAHEYGGGGRGYGVMLQFATNECLIENNIFKHLRHSMIVQAGANGNVFTHNYSLDPFWDTAPSNSAGDMVLHGNYVFCNLFEQNICQNIVIDNSHGTNGPNNTFYRNKADGFGIFFSAANSPNQNFIGNEITNNTFPYNLVNYTIQGSGQLEYANNNKGTITPSGTEDLIDTSLYYSNKLHILLEEDWLSIGPPNSLNTGKNHAMRRYEANNFFFQVCDTSNPIKSIHSLETSLVTLYPNPSYSKCTLKVPNMSYTLEVYDAMGKQIFNQNHLLKGENIISMETWMPGLYFFRLKNAHNLQTIPCIKSK